MTNDHSLNRRELLKVGVAAGGGILIGMYLPQLNSSKADLGGQFHPNAFLRIAADDVVTVILGKSEMGTGIYTALPMILAEELDAAWENVRVEAAASIPGSNSSTRRRTCVQARRFSLDTFGDTDFVRAFTLTMDLETRPARMRTRFS